MILGIPSTSLRVSLNKRDYYSMEYKVTDQQRDALLQIGDTESVAEEVPQGVLEELLVLGFLHYRPTDEVLDFTEIGERVYDELAGL